MSEQGGAVPASLRSKANEFGKGSDQIARIANRVYADGDFQINDFYRQEIGYDNIMVVDFDEPEQSRRQVNGWVAGVTKGLIQDLLPR